MLAQPLAGNHDWDRGLRDQIVAERAEEDTVRSRSQHLSVDQGEGFVFVRVGEWDDVKSVFSYKY